MIEGSNCKERKLSFSTLIGLWVSTSRRISVLSMNPARFPAAPTTGLWYWEEEEESPACTTRATDASQREEQGTEHCGALLGIFLLWGPQE